MVPVQIAPVGIAVTPNDKRVYVANRHSRSLSVISTAKNAVIDTIELSGHVPEDVAIVPLARPNSKGDRFFRNRFTAYVALSTANAVSVVDTHTRQVVGNVGVGALPQRPWSASREKASRMC